MPTAQSIINHTPVPTHITQELFDGFSKHSRFMARQAQGVSENFTSKPSSVINGYPDAHTAKLAHSQSAYIRRKVHGMRDFRKALAPIARSPFENFIDRCVAALKRVEDRTINVINVIFRYTGLEYLIDSLNERLYAKTDVIRAQYHARSQAKMQNDLKKALSRRGKKLPIQPTTTAYIKFAGRSNYDLSSAIRMNDQDAAEKVAVIRREKKILSEIERVEAKHAAREHELRVSIFYNRNTLKALVADHNNAAVASPGDLKNLDGAAAFNFKPQPVTPKMRRAKADMDAIMAKRAETQHQKNRQNAAERQARRDIAGAAGLHQANNGGC